MDLENVSVYRELYFLADNESDCIDYEKILYLYKNYLVFFLSDDSSFYMDCQFLSYVINGFQYCFSLVFPEEIIVDSDEVARYSVANYDRIRKQGNYEASEHSDTDSIFMLSMVCSSKLAKEGLLDFFHEDVQLMLNSNYKISETDRILSKRVKNGM